MRITSVQRRTKPVPRGSRLPFGERAVGREQRGSRRRRRSGWRSIDLAVGEDRDVALVQRTELLVEDGSVDAGEPIVFRVARDFAAVEGVLDPSARCDELREIVRQHGSTLFTA